MKIFYSEYKKNYESYTFGYAIYALQEESDSLAELYSQGFLPYAGESEYDGSKPDQEIHYLARSLRVKLDKFSMSSENRRIDKKAAPFEVQIDVLPKNEFVDDTGLHDFCKQYAAQRFKGGHMNDERWNYVFKRKCGTHIFRFQLAGQILGYVLAGIDENIVHYWFSFFDLTHMDKFPVGKYLMASVIQWARDNNKSYVYLGTCYGPQALYKARDFKGAEFFDGENWNENIATLKSWCKSEEESIDRDRYKINDGK